jgi:ribosomal protein S18 acetylase RimI-like enzyme
MKPIVGSWKRATNQDLPSLLHYLLPQEWRAVPFTSRLLKQGRAFLPSRPGSVVAILVGGSGAGKSVRGAVLLTRGGLLLPVMPYSPGAWQERAAGLSRTPRPEIALPRTLGGGVYSIMGPTAEVRWLESTGGEKPTASVEYALMSLGEHAFRNREPGLSPAPPNLRVRQAEPKDLNALFPLQRAYELEEVVVFPERFSDHSCRLNLRCTLRKQLVVMAELDGRAVAKAGTNARGFQVDQIGGVYTVEALRGSGIASQAMAELLKRLFRTKRMVSLFVKTTNQPALALYRKLGFRSLDGYRISYFQR